MEKRSKAGGLRLRRLQGKGKAGFGSEGGGCVRGFESDVCSCVCDCVCVCISACLCVWYVCTCVYVLHVCCMCAYMHMQAWYVCM